MLLRQPIIKLPDPISFGCSRIQFSDTPFGPESPLERNPLSPMGWKKREAEGVGLSIVAALERSDNDGRSPCIRSVAWPKVEHEHGRNRHGSFFCGSPPRERKDDHRISSATDFLSNCYLCRKNLHGKDIYMYKGEKAFCSTECRYQQIMSDEFQEKCISKVRRPSTTSDMFSTSYTDDHRLFFTGITAA